MERSRQNRGISAWSGHAGIPHILLCGAYITSIIVCLGVKKQNESETALLYGISDAAGV